MIIEPGKAGMAVSMENKTLTLIRKGAGPGPCTVTIDLTSMLRARIYDTPEMRERTVTGFEPRLVQPLADGGLRLQLVNEANGLFIPVEFHA